MSKYPPILDANRSPNRRTVTPTEGGPGAAHDNAKQPEKSRPRRPEETRPPRRTGILAGVGARDFHRAGDPKLKG